MTQNQPEQAQARPATTRRPWSSSVPTASRSRGCPRARSPRQRPRDGDGRRRRRAHSLTDLVEQPAKVMRIGSMIRQLLEEVKAAPLDEASRSRLKEIHQASIKELESGLAPELVEELERLSLPFTEDGVPVGERAADRAGPARRLARRPLPRHPDRDLRPADGRPRPARADAPPAARRSRARCPASRSDPTGPTTAPPSPGRPGCTSRPSGRSFTVQPQAASVKSRRLGGERLRPLGGQPRREPATRTSTSPSRPTIASAAPGAATRVTLRGAAVVDRGELERRASPGRVRRRAPRRGPTPRRPRRRRRSARSTRRRRRPGSPVSRAFAKKTYSVPGGRSPSPHADSARGEVTLTVSVTTVPSSFQTCSTSTT